MSEEQVQENMHHRVSVNTSRLLGYWDFDAGEGDMAADLTGNGHNGSLVNSPDWVKSKAPIGFCNPLLIALQSIEKAIRGKLDLLQGVEAMLDQEHIAMEALAELLAGEIPENRTAELITQARARVFNATVRERHSVKDLETSIRRLEQSLELLISQRPGRGQRPPAINIEATDADLNGDGVVDHIDFTLWSQFWLQSYEIK